MVKFDCISSHTQCSVINSYLTNITEFQTFLWQFCFPQTIPLSSSTWLALANSSLKHTLTRNNCVEIKPPYPTCRQFSPFSSSLHLSLLFSVFIPVYGTGTLLCHSLSIASFTFILVFPVAILENSHLGLVHFGTNIHILLIISRMHSFLLFHIHLYAIF